MAAITHAPDWNIPKLSKEPVPIENTNDKMIRPYHKMLLTALT